MTRQIKNSVIRECLNEKRHDIKVDRNNHKINISKDDYRLILNKIIDKRRVFKI
ncbi:hypothetical protein [Paraclostridium bifermentans]|uniref:hypothetical protein n=1 Tax=Paraclostridium bifermentans TaxID=1490 RepID=UPI00178613E9|nr:hypothetical protein [Paraclostridium bifermentans]